MKMSGNTILITGGTSGIGLELARQLTARGNAVIITARNADRLDGVARELPGVATIQSDAGDPQSVRRLHEQVVRAFPAMNVLINCAGIMRKIDLQQPPALEDVTRELQIDLNGTIWTALQFVEHLTSRDEAAIVNVSSCLAFVPLAVAPIYSAAKAGVHAFTQSLRLQMKNTRVKIFELAQPGIDTPLFHGDFTLTDMGGVKPMPAEWLARKAIAGMERDVLEIRPGLASLVKLMGRIAPGLAASLVGEGGVDAMHGEADGI